MDLQAYVDGQAPAETAEKIRNMLHGNFLLLRRYQDLIEQKRLLLAWWEAQGDDRAL